MVKTLPANDEQKRYSTGFRRPLFPSAGDQVRSLNKVT
jgi:hypothetical protein